MRRVCPPCFDNHGDRAIAILELAGHRPMEWQKSLLRDWMGREVDGTWSAHSCGASVPRQNGKTEDVDGRIAAGMVMYGEWCVYTSHLQKTSTETFETLRSMFESNALSKYVKDIKSALGREEIVLNNGGRCKFLARTRNGGRGQHGDLWVVDEAQEMTDEQQGSFLPMLAASRNPQTIYLGTPPDENAPGEVFSRIRSDALSGKTDSTAWSEWGVDEIGDVADRDRWAVANPSLGYLIKESTIVGELEQMADDRFARERLGWWSKRKAAAVISAKSWDRRATDTPPMDGTPTYSVKFSPDGTTGVIAVCLISDGNVPHVEVVEQRSMSGGIGWFADWLAARWRGCAQIVIDGQGNAQTLTERLLSAKVPSRVIVRPKPRDVASACAGLMSAINEESVTHYSQQSLNDAAYNCTRRDIGTGGGWGFRGNEAGDATLLEAVALALWCASNTRRDPKRKQVIT